MPNRGIKFTGVYMNPKKYDLIPPEMGEMMSSSDKSEENEMPPYPIKSAIYSNDPFYQYKPKHPADVNLLATSNVRFVTKEIIVMRESKIVRILDNESKL